MKRAAALGLLACLLSAPGAAEPLSLETTPIDDFLVGGAELPDGLKFVGGLQVSSGNEDFGGFSGLEVSGDRAFLISDQGGYVRARLVHENGRFTGLAEAEIGSLFPDGRSRKKVSDVEDIAFDPARPERGVVVRERQANALLGFRLQDGEAVDFEPMVVGAENRILRSNKGLESVAYAPASSPAAGQIVAIAERPPRGETNIPGWIAGLGKFAIVRHDDFDVSSARFLANGDLVLLERRFSPAWGIAMRLRRIAGDTVRVGATLDGDYILDAGMTSPIDNMEGLAVSLDSAGRTILTLVSDDNFSLFQRTLILQFALAED